MKRIAASLLCTVVFSYPLSSAFAQANNLQKLLQGTYNSIVVESCKYASAIAGPPSYGPTGQIYTLDLKSKGKMKYDGVGNAVYTATAVGVTIDTTDPGYPAVVTTSYTCNFGYVVKKDGTFTLNGYCDGVDSIGNNWFIPGFQIQGIIGPGKRPDMLLLSVTDPNVQDYYVSGVPALKRLCFSTETQLRCDRGRCFARPN